MWHMKVSLYVYENVLLKFTLRKDHVANGGFVVYEKVFLKFTLRCSGSV